MSSPSPETGLVSVSFRSLPAEQVVALAINAKLDAIEWGGDVHVPVGDLEAARSVSRISKEAGIRIYAYGSYYRAGGIDAKSPPFEDVLETAVELGAPSIRVWAGGTGSAHASDGDVSRIAEDLARICDLAAARSIAVALEFHDGTLTDNARSARALLQRVHRPNLYTYWQPRHGQSVDENLDDISLLMPYLRDVHVFHWWPDHHTRHPLADGADRWRSYLSELSRTGRRHTLALEFVRDDQPQQLMEDARTLRALLKLM